MKNSRVSNLAAREMWQHSEKLGSEEEELGGVGKRQWLWRQTLGFELL